MITKQQTQNSKKKEVRQVGGILIMHFLPVCTVEITVVVILFQPGPGLIEHLPEFSLQVSVKLIADVNLLHLIIIDVEKEKKAGSQYIVFVTCRFNVVSKQVGAHFFGFFIIKRL